MITIIHLSDFHVKTSSYIDDQKIESLANIINSLPKSIRDIFIVLTGDIAFSGLAEEYNKATNMLYTLKSLIVQRDIKFIITPGNHDCNFSDTASTRDPIIQNIVEQKKYDKNQIAYLSSVQNNFFNFRNEFIENITTNDKLATQQSFKTNSNHTITFLSINTAWMSTLVQQPGSIYLDPGVFDSGKKNDFNILAMHHTPNWLISDSQKFTRERFIKNFDFILTGHEHQSSSYNIQTSDIKDSVSMIEGEEFTPEKNYHKSGFNILTIDEEAKTYKISNYRHHRSLNIYSHQTQITNDFIPFTKKTANNCLRF